MKLVKSRVLIGLLLLLCVEVICCNTSSPEQEPTAQQPPAETEKKQEAVAVTRPTIPPPTFRVYRSKLDDGTSVIVSPDTTDEQLKSLLWLFRIKVRSHRFNDIGITQPTREQWGKKGYLSGTISVYRDEKCANEYFSDYTGPCVGPGTHGNEAASYGWGDLIDGVFNADADLGTVYTKDESHNRKPIVVFDDTKHWEPPAELDAQMKTQQGKSQR